jgi:hypothetical protein
MSFVPQQNVLYRFVSGLDSDFVLDVSQNKAALGNLIVYKWNNGPNQKFAIRPIQGQPNKFAFFSAKDNNTVEVANSDTKKGAKVIASHPDKQNNEFW